MFSAFRRRWLGAGAVGLAGTVGVVAGGRLAQTAGASGSAAAWSAQEPVASFRLFGRHWHLSGDAPRARWARPERGDQFVAFGELVDGAGASGVKIGEFYATCNCVNVPFGDGPTAARYVEHHTLNLVDGTITAMGTSMGDESTFAVVGGTGRYAGARGSYVARQSPTERGGDGTAEIVVTLEAAV